MKKKNLKAETTSLSNEELTKKLESLIPIEGIEGEIDFKKLEKLLQMGAGLKECCFYFGVSEDYLKERVLDKYKMTFRELKEYQKSAMKMMLRAKMLEQAMKGDTKALFYLSEKYLDKEEENLKVLDLNNEQLLNILLSTEGMNEEGKQQPKLEVISDNSDSNKDKDDL